MDINEFKIGQIGDGNPDELISEITAFATSSMPALIKPSGEVFSTARSAFDRNHLWEMPIASGDLLIVGPHGEIVPFVAAAFGQKVLDHANSAATKLIHIDAHYDNVDSCARPYLNGKNHSYDAEQTSGEIEAFIRQALSGSSETVVNQAFQSLVQTTQGDIQTFITALRHHVNQIVACVRGEETNVSYSKNYGPMSIEMYGDVRRREKTRKPLVDLIAETTGNLLYSVDADFTGVTDIHNYMTPGDELTAFTKSTRFLLESLVPEVEKMRRDVAEATGRVSLYTVSVDPLYCYRPERFLKIFIDKFYTKIMSIYKEAPAQPQVPTFFPQVEFGKTAEA